MVLKIKNDLGTLHCSFDSINVWFCDNKSNELFENIEKRMCSLYGEGCKLDYVLIDCEKVDVKLFRIGQENILPFLSVSFSFFFRTVPDCDLLKFVNYFSRKCLTFVNGRASLKANRNYLRCVS